MSTNLTVTNNLSVGNSITSSNVTTSNATISSLNVQNLSVSQSLNTGNLSSFNTNNLITQNVNTNQLTASTGAIIGNLTLQPSNVTMNYNLSGSNATHNFQNNVNVNGTFNTTGSTTIGNYITISTDITNKVVNYDINGLLGTHVFKDNTTVNGVLTCSYLTLNGNDVDSRLTSDQNNITNLQNKTTNISLSNNTTSISGILSTPSLLLNGSDITTLYAPISNPTFNGTITSTKINATGQFQLNGTNINTIYAPISNPSFVGNTTVAGNVTANRVNATSQLQLNGTDISTIYAPINNPSFSGTIQHNGTDISTLYASTNDPTVNNSLTVNNGLKAYSNTVISNSYASKTLGTSNILISTITIPTKFSSSISISSPISVYRLYKNISANVNLTNAFLETITSITYTINKNGILYASGTCSSNNTLPKSIYLISASNTNNMSYEVYMTNANLIFSPANDGVQNTYTIYLSVNGSYNGSFQASNRTDVSYGYYFNTDVTTITVTRSGGTIGTGSNVYSATGLTTYGSNYFAVNYAKAWSGNYATDDGEIQSANAILNNIYTQNIFNNGFNLIPQTRYLSGVTTVYLSSLNIGYLNYITIANSNTNDVNFVIDIYNGSGDNGLSIIFLNQMSSNKIIFTNTTTESNFSGLVTTSTFNLNSNNKVCQMSGMANVWIVTLLTV